MGDILQRIAMKAVILNGNGQVLILREAGASYTEGTNEGKWQIPGGRINPGEKWRDGLDREVFEETGLRVVYKQPVYVGEWFPVINGVQNHIVAVFHLCEYDSGEVILSEEHDDFCWVDGSNLAQYSFMGSELKAIQSAIESK